MRISAKRASVMCPNLRIPTARVLLFQALSTTTLVCGALALTAAISVSHAQQPPASNQGTQENPLELEGTVIVDGEEVPLGLYITSWRDPEPEPGIDRPAQLLDEALVPLDPDAFRRQLLYWQALEAARAAPASAAE